MNMGRVLEPIQQYCLDERLPPLTSLVVSKDRGKPGKGFIAWDARDPDGARELVYGFDWGTLRNPFEAFGPYEEPATIARQVFEKRIESTKAYTRIKVRGMAQIVFREELMLAYRGHCAICGASIPALLEAAHVVPWSDASDDERMSIANGLLLCRNHHALFDRGILVIGQDYTVTCTSDLLSVKQDGYEEATRYDASKLRVPEDSCHRPDPELIVRGNQLRAARSWCKSD